MTTHYFAKITDMNVFDLQDCGVGKDDLTQIELQICVDFVNTVVQDEHDCKSDPVKHVTGHHGAIDSYVVSFLWLLVYL